MRNSNTNRQSIIRGRSVQHTEEIGLTALQGKLRNVLVLRNVDQSKLEEFQAISTIDHLLQKFTEISLEPSFSHMPTTSSSTQKQLLFYRERISSLQKRLNDTKTENLLLLRNVSNRQAEICEKQQQIFELKSGMEEKQKAIIRLMNTVREKGKVNQVGLGKKEEQDIKIIVNSPPLKQQPKPQPFKPPVYPSANADWLAQKQRLLRVIKQKDLKIYDLILQLQSK